MYLLCVDFFKVLKFFSCGGEVSSSESVGVIQCRRDILDPT